MRITNGMMVSGFMTDLNNNLQRLAKYQTQMETNRRIQRLSDDPVGVITGLQARERLYRLEQFQRNIGDAKRWLTTSESATMEMNDVVKNAYETVIDAATDAKGSSDRQALAPLIKAMLDHAVSLGNTTVSAENSFGGFNTTGTPFTLGTTPPNDGKWLYNGKPVSEYDQAALDADTAGNTIEFQVGYAMNTKVSLTGPQLMVYDSSTKPNKNVIDTLQGLYDALSKPDSRAADIQPFITDLQNAQEHLNAMAAEFGGRWNRLEMMEDRYSKDELMYTEIKSNVEDVDAAEAIMNFSMAQTVYNASLQAGARVIQPTLLDYLR